MRIEFVIAGVFIAGTAVGLVPTIVGAQAATKAEPARDYEVCWAKDEDGNLHWAKFPKVGGTCPFELPDAYDPDQESATTAEVQK